VLALLWYAVGFLFFYLAIYLALLAGIVLYPHERSAPQSAAGTAKMALIIWAFFLTAYYLPRLLMIVFFAAIALCTWFLIRMELKSSMRADSANKNPAD
jgi:hypothetical protein